MVDVPFPIYLFNLEIVMLRKTTIKVMYPCDNLEKKAVSYTQNIAHELLATCGNMSKFKLAPFCLEIVVYFLHVYTWIKGIETENILSLINKRHSNGL